MKSFVQLAVERAANPERCVREAQKLMNRYAHVSGNKKIDLEEASWLAAIYYLGLNEVIRSQQETVNENGARVVNVLAQSGSTTEDAIA